MTCLAKISKNVCGSSALASIAVLGVGNDAEYRVLPPRLWKAMNTLVLASFSFIVC